MENVSTSVPFSSHIHLGKSPSKCAVKRLLSWKKKKEVTADQSDFGMRGKINRASVPHGDP